MQKALALILSMLCLTACDPIKIGPPPPPAEKLVCKGEPSKPDISPLQAFQAENGALVYSKADVDARDAKIAVWIVSYRGSWFSCSSNLEWNKNYWAGQ